MKTCTIIVKGAEVAIATRHEQDYISLTDMLRHFGDENILYGWLRNRNTIEFLGIWERLYNPEFKPIEFDRFRAQAGLLHEKHRTIVSNLLTEAARKGRIKRKDPDATSSKFVEYVPYWA